MLAPHIERADFSSTQDNDCCHGCDVKRAELEARLKALGWAPTGQASGRNHTVWTRKGRKLVVPAYDLIFDSNANAILADAEG